MAKIIINDWSKGLAPRYYQGGFNLAKLAVDGMYADGVINPIFYSGFLSPASSVFTNYSNITALTANQRIIKFQSVDDGNFTGTSVYFIQGEKVHAFDPATFSIINAAEFPHTINATAGTHSGHTSETVQDIVFYQVNGADKLCYFYIDNTDGDMGTYDLASSFTINSANENVWSSAAGGAVFNKNFPIIAEVADNGFMYVANGQNIYKYNGTSAGGTLGTVTSLLDFGINRKVVDMKDGLGKMWIVISEAESTTTLLSNINRFFQVGIWNRSSTVLSFDDSIPITGIYEVSSLFFWKGIPHLFTIGGYEDSVVQLRTWNGREFEVIQEIGDALTIPANRNAVILIGLGIIWHAKNGKIFFYGKIAPGFPEGLYKVGISPASTNKTGAIFKQSNNIIPMSFNDGTDERLAYWTLGTGDTSAQGDWYSKIYELPKLSKLTGMTLYFPVLSGGSNVNATVKLYKNYSATSLGSFSVNLQDDGNRGYKYFPLGGETFENINAIQMEIEFPTNVATASNIRFSRIEIDYEITDKKI